MLRYVYIGDQVIEGGEQFAFFDTVADSFLEYGGDTVFDGFDDLVEVYDADKYTQHDWSRLLALMPAKLSICGLPVVVSKYCPPDTVYVMRSKVV